VVKKIVRLALPGRSSEAAAAEPEPAQPVVSARERELVAV
jgi:hypothetical protein